MTAHPRNVQILLFSSFSFWLPMAVSHPLRSPKLKLATPCLRYVLTQVLGVFSFGVMEIGKICFICRKCGIFIDALICNCCDLMERVIKEGKKMHCCIIIMNLLGHDSKGSIKSSAFISYCKS